MTRVRCTLIQVIVSGIAFVFLYALVLAAFLGDANVVRYCAVLFHYVK
jgi:hypothetical protein